jgi:hypothetical protein
MPRPPLPEPTFNPIIPPLSSFTYNSIQSNQTRMKGKTISTTRRVKIQNGKGFKEVVTRTGGKTRRARKPLTRSEIRHIQHYKFVPGLFKSCYECIKKMD